MSVPVPRMIGTVLSRNPGIPASKGNLASNVWAVGNGNKSLVLLDWKPWSDLGPDGHDRVLETLE